MLAAVVTRSPAAAAKLRSRSPLEERSRSRSLSAADDDNALMLNEGESLVEATGARAQLVELMLRLSSFLSGQLQSLLSITPPRASARLLNAAMRLGGRRGVGRLRVEG